MSYVQASGEAQPASRWRVEILDGGSWSPRSSARDDRDEAETVLARLQAKQPGEQFRVWPVGGAS